MGQAFRRITMIQFPGMRREFILDVHDMFDKNMQQTNWIVENNNYGFWANLRDRLDILDILDSNFKNSIGVIFRDQNEANIARQLAVTLDKTLDKIGIEQTDSAYLNSPLWDDVVEAAKHAYDVLMKDEDLEALCEAEEKRVIE
jgi:hypothetical protein